MAYTPVYTSDDFAVTLETGRFDEFYGQDWLSDDQVMRVALPDTYTVTYNSPGWTGHRVGSYATLDLAMAEIGTRRTAGKQIAALGEQMLRDAREG